MLALGVGLTAVVAIGAVGALPSGVPLAQWSIVVLGGLALPVLSLVYIRWMYWTQIANGVEVTDEQFPDLWAIYADLARQMGFGAGPGARRRFALQAILPCGPERRLWFTASADSSPEAIAARAPLHPPMGPLPRGAALPFPRAGRAGGGYGRARERPAARGFDTCPAARACPWRRVRRLSPRLRRRPMRPRPSLRRF